MPRQFALSDIHGCRRTFLALLDQLALRRGDELYLLGDYINRGPDSKGVIDAIWQLQADGYQVHTLMGNHEWELLKDGRGDELLLDSFGIQDFDDIPKQYTNWMKALPRYAELPGYVLVHAGLHFGPADPYTETRDLLYIRRWYDTIDRDWLGQRIIVHGHTPQPAEETRWQVDRLAQMPALCIDCGCAVDETPLNQLCAFDLTNRRLYFQENV